jgi:hypothetical protein
MKKYISYGLLCSFILMALAACGGGGGDYTGGASYTKTAFKINLSGDLAGKAIMVADFTLILPANVTPDMVSNTPVDATGVVTMSGAFVGITPYATYIPATDTNPGKLKLLLTSNTEAGVTTIGNGEVATVTLQQLAGTVPVAAKDFTDKISVIVKDLSAATIEGLTPSVADMAL